MDDNKFMTEQMGSMSSTQVHREKEPEVFRLHLEIPLEWADDEAMEILKKHGKVNNGLSRDILVSSDMSLHELHYAIQRAFGWQNSHLHSFALPFEVFNSLTGGSDPSAQGSYNEYGEYDGSFLQWVKLCGSYFRFPIAEMEDIYWDDDFKGDISIKSWLRRKYTHYSGYGGESEHFFTARSMAELFVSENQKLLISPSFAEWQELKEAGKLVEGKGNAKEKSIEDTTVAEIGRGFENGMDELLERLKVSEVLCPEGCEPADREAIKDLIASRDRLYDECCKKYSGKESHEDAALTHDDIPWKEDSITVLPVAKELFYHYDYGDSWEIHITCPESYYTSDRSGDARGKNLHARSAFDRDSYIAEKQVYDHADKLIEGDEAVEIATVAVTRKPAGVSVDGLNVMDDVGGLYGYVDFLHTIHGKDPDEKEEMREWGKSMGWTGRMVKPKSLL